MSDMMLGRAQVDALKWRFPDLRSFCIIEVPRATSLHIPIAVL